MVQPLVIISYILWPEAYKIALVMNRIRSSLPWTAKNVVRIVRLQGMITPDARPGGRGFNFLKVEKHIEEAFDTKKIKPKAVCLEINSRGGSPVQSSLIFHRIRALSKENDVPVLSFAEDTAASGGYWLALAGDEIFVDPNSIVGNIGAMYGTFGMEETIKKLGRFINPELSVHFCKENRICSLNKINLHPVLSPPLLSSC